MKYLPVKQFNYLLAFHCAPTFAGLKAANLISINAAQWDEAKAYLRLVGRLLSQKEILFFRVSESGERILLLVYHRELLRCQLSDSKNRHLLEYYGYAPQEASLGQMLIHLAKRFQSCGDFPHEIGVFLGYPPEDVIGFIQNEGKNCRFCGFWKVYGDTEYARCQFTAYHRAQEYFCAKVLSGEEIHTIQYGGAVS